LYGVILQFVNDNTNGYVRPPTTTGLLSPEFLSSSRMAPGLKDCFAAYDAAVRSLRKGREIPMGASRSIDFRRKCGHQLLSAYACTGSALCAQQIFSATPTTLGVGDGGMANHPRRSIAINCSELRLGKAWMPSQPTQTILISLPVAAWGFRSGKQEDHPVGLLMVEVHLSPVRAGNCTKAPRGRLFPVRIYHPQSGTLNRT
jgi:hypothetical protein